MDFNEFDPLKQYNQDVHADVGDIEDPWKKMNLNRDSQVCPVVVDTTSESGFDDNFTESSSSRSTIRSDEFERSMEEIKGSTKMSFHRHSLTVRDQMAKKYMINFQDKFTTIKTYRIFCGTWNVNGQPASVDISPWLQYYGNDLPDIYALGFQELDLSKEAFLFNESARENEWLAKVAKALPEKGNYIKVKHVRLVGMMLIVCVKRELQSLISNIRVAQAATGILGLLGNKGGVSIRLDFQDTSFCFVNAHLAAHAQEYERRNQDYRDINYKTRFDDPSWDEPLKIANHDRIFWIGDFNYRLTGIEIDEVKTALQNEELLKLFHYDQLKNEMKSGKVFQGFEEPEITFIPTYKFNTGTDEWDSSEKCRCPAWCDRILFRGDHISASHYESHMTLKISDHKPVSSLFNVGVQVINQRKYKEVYEEVMKKLDRLENDVLPQASLNTLEVNFKNVVFIEQQMREIEITNTGQGPIQFEFINKLDDDTSYCKPWLSVSPPKGFLMTGQTKQLTFEVYINKNTAHKLNAGDDKIEDILVLHLEGGKDFFISVTGSYVPSCFGSSIEALVNMYQPICEVPTAQLVNLEHIPTTPKGEKNFSYSPTVRNIESLDVPKELWKMIDHLYQYGKQIEGLFQQPGLHYEVQQIRDCLDKGTPDILPGTVHSVAEGLLIFLEALPEPVIPFDLYDRCISAAHSYDECKLVLNDMPVFHHTIFVHIASFLRELLKYSEHNQLEADTLASIFGSVMLRCTQIHKSKHSRQIEYERKTKFMSNFLNHEYDI